MVYRTHYTAVVWTEWIISENIYYTRYTAGTKLGYTPRPNSPRKSPAQEGERSVFCSTLSSEYFRSIGRRRSLREVELAYIYMELNKYY